MIGQETPLDLGAELNFLRAIWALDHALQKRSKRMAKELGVTGPQRLALRIVSRFPGIPAGRLARLLHLHPSTVTGVMKQLIERRLMSRLSDGPDRRRSLLRITPSGLALLGQPQPTIESAVAEALRTLSAREVEATIKALGVVALGLRESTARTGVTEEAVARLARR